MNIKYTSRFIAAVLLSALSFAASAQEQPDLRHRADRLFDEYQYSRATAIYQELAGRKKPKLHDLERLAESYSKMNKYEAAEHWYSLVVKDPKSNVTNLLNYGETLKNNGKYHEAKNIFMQYARKTGNALLVAVDIAGCDSALAWKADSTAHKIKNEAGVNSKLANFGAFPLGDHIYYSAEPDSLADRSYGWTGNSFLSIHTAARSADNSLHTPVLDLNSDYNKQLFHAGPIAGNKRGTVLLVTRTYPGKETEVNLDKRRRFKTNNIELFIYSKTDSADWDIKPFKYNNAKKYSLGQAALSPDEQTLYFVSDMPAGMGGTDIWFSELQADGSWGEPKNAGYVVNTVGNEMFPYIAADSVMYYSSNGLPGMGGLDIFSASGSKDRWKEVKNLRYPVNSGSDDFAFFTENINASESRGYLSSNRKGGAGGDDIYSFTYTATSTSDKKNVIAASATSLSGKGNFIGPGTTDQILQNDSSADLESAGNGSGSKDTGSEANGQDKQTDVTVVGGGKINSADLVKGKTFRLANIHYDFDKDNINEVAAAILDDLVEVMNENPGLEIEMASHTDARGDDSYNLALSQRRAQAAVNYMISKGVARTRMSAKGYGETRILNGCVSGIECAEVEHQANRRTEFTVTNL